MNTNDGPEKSMISKEPDFCEECGEIKPVIIRVKWRYIIKEWICEFIERSRKITK